jgi:uncharacterized protein (TIGR02246 family)
MFDIGDDSAGPADDVQAIERAIRTAAAAAEAGDGDAVLAMFRRDAGTVLFEFNIPGVTTLADLRRNFDALFANAAGPFTCRYPRITVRVLSDTAAFSVAYAHIAATMHDGSALDLHERVTNVWQKVDGRWLSVHEHNSVPVDLASGRFIPKQPI